jgi:hypothetical protein
MSQENMEIVRRVYEAGDLGSALRDAHPDFEFTFKAGPNAGTHQGREEAQALLSDLSPCRERRSSVRIALALATD